jgi:STE24 endopeptidase
VAHSKLVRATCVIALLVLAGGTGRLLGADAAVPAEAVPLAPQNVAPSSPPEAARPEPKEVKGYTLPPEKYRRAVTYARARYKLYFVGFAYGLVVLLAVLRSRLAPRLRDLAERRSTRRAVQAMLFAPPLLLTLDLLALPTHLYGHWLSLQYNQSVQGWASWLWDWTKSELIALSFGTLVITFLYWVMRRNARRWWFYFWLGALPVIAVVVFLFPVVIEPLFFRFEPLARTQPQLAVQMETVVQHAGLRIPPDHLFEMKASEKLNEVNAYVTGLGASKRVVVWDTTIAKMTTPQILSVFGHEMGHYVLGHVWKGMVFSAGVLLVFLYLGQRALGRMLARSGRQWGIRGVDDWASLPVLLLLFSVFSFLSAPVDNAFSRYLEHQADTYALEVTHGVVPDAPETAAQAFQILGEIDLEDPAPPLFVKFWLYTHPPLNERIVFARTYDPWSKGESPQFVH